MAIFIQFLQFIGLKATPVKVKACPNKCASKCKNRQKDAVKINVSKSQKLRRTHQKANRSLTVNTAKNDSTVSIMPFIYGGVIGSILADSGHTSSDSFSGSDISGSSSFDSGGGGD